MEVSKSTIKGIYFVVGLSLAGAGVWLAQHEQAALGIITVLIGAFLIVKALE